MVANVINQNAYIEIEKVLDLSDQITIYKKGLTHYLSINKAHGRFAFSDDRLTVSIYDALFENNYWCKTNELKNDTSEVESTGTVTLDSGAAGSVDGITVDGVEIMSEAVDYDADLTTTAENVVANINAFQSDYLASNVGAIITITALAYDKTTANGFVIVSSTTTLVSTDVNMASGVTAIISDVDEVTDEAAVSVYLGAFVGV